ncbi:hypothetical protein PIB30_086301 [Stylosanthes scabra]|uniref:Uncharacterized protein n=1 Tax=Stylosanthes scabra TaxID=79078 RepID=A0ABU6QSN2_9FABA|nr:hypothetical protein [Stylosanthes scabra]
MGGPARESSMTPNYNNDNEKIPCNKSKWILAHPTAKPGYTWPPPAPLAPTEVALILGIAEESSSSNHCHGVFSEAPHYSPVGDAAKPRLMCDRAAYGMGENPNY